MADWDNEADSQCMVDLDATGNTKLDQMKQWVPFLKSLCDKAAGGCMQRLIELDSEMMKKKAESCGLPVDCNVCGEYVAFSNSFVKDCGKDEAISMMMPPSDAAVMWAALEQIEIGYGLMCKAKPGVGPAKPPGADKPGEEKVDKEVKKDGWACESSHTLPRHPASHLPPDLPCHLQEPRARALPAQTKRP